MSVRMHWWSIVAAVEHFFLANKDYFHNNKLVVDRPTNPHFLNSNLWDCSNTISQTQAHNLSGSGVHLMPKSFVSYVHEKVM